MDLTRREALQGAAVALLGTSFLAGCGSGSSDSVSSTHASLRLSDDAWEYDATNDVYYQLGQYYVSRPAAKAYENLGIYVPGKYLSAKKNGSDKYTATISTSGRVGGFTAATAPIVFPVNTPGYAAQQPPTSYSYSDVSEYLEAGFIYVCPGLRGRDSETSSYYGNAPWGVTDLKSAIRFIRYNSDLIPGDTERIFVFGMSGGGAQTAVTGASGDSPLYTPYFDAIGTALTDQSGKTLSDAIAGAMCWCPITSLDWANAAYEWNMGQFASAGTRAKGTWTKAYSNDLADAFAKYINMLGLKSTSGKALSLQRTAAGQYLGGSYYEHLIAVIETSLNDFLSYTKFPYTQSSGMMGGAGGGGSAPSGARSNSGGAPSGGAPSGSGGAPSGGAPSASGSAPSGAPSGSRGPSTTSTTDTDTGTTSNSGTSTAALSGSPGGSAPGGSSGSMPGGSSTGKTFKTVEKYIAYLNSAVHWVDYDATTKRAKVLNLRGFVTSQKPPRKDVGAFDGIARGETENLVLGHGTSPLHFARVSRSLIASHQSRYSRLTGWQSAYDHSAYDHDFALTDSIGKNQAYRVNMYNPMYFISDYYDGYRSGTVAPNWRIRTGIMQGDTANTVEINLALALQDYGITNVDFATVWGEAHTEAETTGQPDANFIAWVKRSLS